MKFSELAGIVTVIANAIASKLTSDEIALAAAVLVQLGDTLTTIAAQQILCSNKNENKG